MRVLLTMAVLALAVAARADTLVLRGGGRIGGVIVGETSNDVTITMGPGRATFKRAQIVAIERENDAANRELTAAWQQTYFADPRNLPPALHDVARRYRTATDLQPAAEQALKRRTDTLKEIQRLGAEREKLHAEINDLSSRVARLDPKRDAETYNTLARQNNERVGRIGELDRRRLQLATAADADAAAYVGFLGEAAATLDAGERAKRLQLTNEAARVFFEKTAPTLAAWKALLGEIDLDTGASRGGHMTVAAVVNHARSVRLLVDTGASIVTLSEKAAARCGVHWNRSEKIEVRLANGTTAEVYPAVLQSLTVQGVTLAGVEAAVVPETADARESDHDGLLGMSFLSAFTMQMDPAGGRLILRRKKPEQ